MKTFKKKGILFVVTAFLISGLLSCKSSDSPSTITIDISSLKEKLNISEPSSSNSETNSEPISYQTTSSEKSQDEVVTLLIAPLTFSNHGKTYSTTEYSDSDEDDLEKDAVNSADYLQFIQLSSNQSTVTIEVPSMSDGWQLIAAATSVKINDVNDFSDDKNDGTIKYLGFTENSYKSAEEFNNANPTLTLTRNCDQDAEYRPKGCATFDSDEDAIVSAAVEIHGMSINGSVVTPANDNFPWIVRDTPGTGETTPATAITNLKATLTAYKNANVGTAIKKITVTSTHQLSSGKSDECKALTYQNSTSDFDDRCGFQTSTKNY